MIQRSRRGSASRLGDAVRRQGVDGALPDIGQTKRVVYLDRGHAVPGPAASSTADALAFAHRDAERTVLLLYAAPTPVDVQELATAWHLHPLMVEDILDAGQRPKLQRFGDVLFLVMRSARYDDESERVEFAEFHVVVSPGAVAVLCQDGVWLDGRVDAAALDRAEQILLTGDPALGVGADAIAYRLLDAVVGAYEPVLSGLSIDKEQIEREVFTGAPTVTERIYRLSQEVVELGQATAPLTEVLAALADDHGSDARADRDPIRTYLHDVADDLDRVDGRVTRLRESLSQVLSVNATLVAQRQNGDMKKISAWAAILFAPSLIAANYGMNFDHIPELRWEFGYPLAVAGMLVFALVLYLVFKRQKWM